ncbi:MAG TPA: hypothetical protein VFB16_02110 [Bauldia sp.]|nr:hypothetical protein [Bauldia sp.]
MNAPHRCVRASLIAALFALAGESLPAAAAAPVKWNRVDTGQGWTIVVPEGYAVNPSYRYDQLGAGRTIAGTAFTVPERIWKGSNLSADSYLSVEEIRGAAKCTAALFLPAGAEVKSVTDKGQRYTLGTFGDAGAGNFYDQTVYARATGARCIGVRYFIHATNIGNYDPGTVEEFNRAGLIAQWDKIRRSISFP